MLYLREKLFGKRGQNTAEYAIVISLVIGAAIAMQTYIKRGIEQKAKLRVDAFSSAGGFVANQYEPYYLDTVVDVDSTSKTTDQDFGSAGSERQWEGAARTVQNVHQVQNIQ